jgi:hypothetical protein
LIHNGLPLHCHSVEGQALRRAPLCFYLLFYRACQAKRLISSRNGRFHGKLIAEDLKRKLGY